MSWLGQHKIQGECTGYKLVFNVFYEGFRYMHGSGNGTMISSVSSLIEGKWLFFCNTMNQVTYMERNLP